MQVQLQLQALRVAFRFAFQRVRRPQAAQCLQRLLSTLVCRQLARAALSPSLWQVVLVQPALVLAPLRAQVRNQATRAARGWLQQLQQLQRKRCAVRPARTATPSMPHQLTPQQQMLQRQKQLRASRVPAPSSQLTALCQRGLTAGLWWRVRHRKPSRLLWQQTVMTSSMAMTALKLLAGTACLRRRLRQQHLQ